MGLWDFVTSLVSPDRRKPRPQKPGTNPISRHRSENCVWVRLLTVGLVAGPKETKLYL
jgi:hypothetical protein